MTRRDNYFLILIVALHGITKRVGPHTLRHSFATDLLEDGVDIRISPVRKKRWVVYAKPPFAGPEAVLADLSRYTHRVAISNRRLLAFDEAGVTFSNKD